MSEEVIYISDDRDHTVFELVLMAYVQNQAGTINLRKIVEPLWGDHNRIYEFYAMCDDFVDMTKDYERIDVNVLELLQNANVEIPPRPGTLRDVDPLRQTADGRYYVDPLAASECLAKQFESATELAAVLNASVSTDPNAAAVQINEFVTQVTDPESLDASTGKPENPDTVSLMDIAKAHESSN